MHIDGKLEEKKNTPPNRRPDAQRFLVSASLLTVITMADLRFPASYCSLRRLSLISQRGRAFSCILVEDSTSRWSNSILPSPRYLSSDILCTLRRCQCSSTSIPTTAGSTNFVARISMFDSREIITPALAFSVRSADTAPDGDYLTRQNRVCRPSPAFCNALFSASMRSASDI